MTENIILFCRVEMNTDRKNHSDQNFISQNTLWFPYTTMIFCYPTPFFKRLSVYYTYCCKVKNVLFFNLPFSSTRNRYNGCVIKASSKYVLIRSSEN